MKHCPRSIIPRFDSISSLYTIYIHHSVEAPWNIPTTYCQLIVNLFERLTTFSVTAFIQEVQEQLQSDTRSLPTLLCISQHDDSMMDALSNDAIDVENLQTRSNTSCVTRHQISTEAQDSCTDALTIDGRINQLHRRSQFQFLAQSLHFRRSFPLQRD